MDKNAVARISKYTPNNTEHAPSNCSHIVHIAVVASLVFYIFVRFISFERLIQIHKNTTALRYTQTADRYSDARDDGSRPCHTLLAEAVQGGGGRRNDGNAPKAVGAGFSFTSDIPSQGWGRSSQSVQTALGKCMPSARRVPNQQTQPEVTTLAATGPSI